MRHEFIFCRTKMTTEPKTFKTFLLWPIQSSRELQTRMEIKKTAIVHFTLEFRRTSPSIYALNEILQIWGRKPENISCGNTTKAGLHQGIVYVCYCPCQLFTQPSLSLARIWMNYWRYFMPCLCFNHLHRCNLDAMFLRDQCSMTELPFYIIKQNKKQRNHGTTSDL